MRLKRRRMRSKCLQKRNTFELLNDVPPTVNIYFAKRRKKVIFRIILMGKQYIIWCNLWLWPNYSSSENMVLVDKRKRSRFVKCTLKYLQQIIIYFQFIFAMPFHLPCPRNAPKKYSYCAHHNNATIIIPCT